MPGCEVKNKYVHVRVRDPDDFHKDSLRTIKLSKNVKGVIGCPKGKKWTGKRCSGGTRLQKKMYKNTKRFRKYCKNGEWKKKK